MPGYMGVSVTGNGFTVGTGGTNPGYFNSDGFQIADDLDVVRGRHQLSFGGNWIHTQHRDAEQPPDQRRVHVQRPDAPASALADFMLGRVSSFVQGNPVYDYDHNDYVGAYVQDDWQLRPNLTLNVGLRWEPFLPIKNTLRLGEPLRPGAVRRRTSAARSIRRRRPGLMFPGDAGYPGIGGDEQQAGAVRAARRRRLDRLNDRTSDPRRRGACSTTRRICSSTRASRTTRRGARRSRSPTRPAASPIRTSTIPAATRSRRWTPDGQTQPFPTAGVYVNAPLDTEPTTLQQWNVSAQRQFGDWLADRELSRQPLQPSVARDRAELRGLRAGRDHRDDQRSAARWCCRTRRRGSSTARSVSSTTPAAPTTTACCCRCSAG